MVAQSRSFICTRLTTFSKALACAHPSDGWAANVHRQETLTQASKALVESCLVSGIKMYKLQYDVKQKYLLPLPLPCSYYSLHLTYRLTISKPPPSSLPLPLPCTPALKMIIWAYSYYIYIYNLYLWRRVTFPTPPSVDTLTKSAAQILNKCYLFCFPANCSGGRCLTQPTSTTTAVKPSVRSPSSTQKTNPTTKRITTPKGKVRQ